MHSHFFSEIIKDNIGSGTEVMKVSPIGGGCINQAAQIGTNKGDFFIKWNPANPEMFETEAAGITMLSRCNLLKLPKIYGYGIVNEIGYLLLEFVQKEKVSEKYWNNLGTGLAELHRSNTAPEFGLGHDNFIGRLSQSNTLNSDWSTFFINQRLLPQIELAENNDLINSSLIHKFEKLFKLLPELFPKEKPALLHGDLWSGNVMPTSNNMPFIYDPAVYYGNRETELAFTMLFGGFDKKFYNVYRDNFPLAIGFKNRAEVYNLYPLLVHVNLFGSSYLTSIESTLRKFS